MPQFDGSTPGPGRPKGIPNKATQELKAFWTEFFASKAYQRNLEKRILQGKAPHMESYLAGMCYGKPKEQHEHTGEGGGPIQLMFGGRYKQGAK